jgi:hypothetical protein
MNKETRLSTEWIPDQITIYRMRGECSQEAYLAFRVSSTGYTRKKGVRLHLHEKHNSKCALCDSETELHIDHIESVRKCFDRGALYFCNSLSNLQLLCSQCNVKKSS